MFENPGGTPPCPQLPLPVGSGELPEMLNLNDIFTPQHEATVPSNQRRSYGILRPGAKYIFAPPPTKIAEFEGENKRNSVEKTKQNILLFVISVIFEVIKYVEG